MTTEALVIITGACVSFLTSGLTGGFALWRESRNRRWEIEDRKAKAAALQAEFERKLAAQTAQLDSMNRARTDKVLGKIQEGTNLATSAIRESNNTSARITAVHKRIDTVIDKLPPGTPAPIAPAAPKDGPPE